MTPRNLQEEEEDDDGFPNQNPLGNNTIKQPNLPTLENTEYGQCDSKKIIADKCINSSASACECFTSNDFAREIERNFNSAWSIYNRYLQYYPDDEEDINPPPSDGNANSTSIIVIQPSGGKQPTPSPTNDPEKEQCIHSNAKVCT